MQIIYTLNIMGLYKNMQEDYTNIELFHSFIFFYLFFVCMIFMIQNDRRIYNIHFSSFNFKMIIERKKNLLVIIMIVYCMNKCYQKTA